MRPTRLWVQLGRHYSVGKKAHFDKILVANRGEIACRIMRTAKRLGIKTVAVFSEADKTAEHVELADEAYLIGPPPSDESYLVIDHVVDVARRSNSQAIHPGYGFLSENYRFAERLAKEGIGFIGPPVQAIKDMGSKSASKNIMAAAKVPVIPGYHGEVQTLEYLRKMALEVKYPIMIKAVMGGGGKGMRIVRNASEFNEMLESSRREAKKSFGDDRVLLEKYLERPRHVEVQVFADMHGNAVYLYERDCSLQRRHQKILEEAPAPNLSEELRKSLGEKAVAAAKAVKYVGAGTVEFILDCDTNEFYFMEMNTRLQVEHPVTEMITGQDLVEWQLLVAAGNPLPLAQENIPRNGHAFEARIYAENPYNNFLPETGELAYLAFPKQTGNLRVESGVRQGDQVSVYYDPMIAKIVASGSDRDAALRTLGSALAELQIVGPRTNVDFLSKIVRHDAFRNCELDTGFIMRYARDLLCEPVPTRLDLAQAAIVFACATPRQDLGNDPWSLPDRFRPGYPSTVKFSLSIGGNDVQFQTTAVGESLSIHITQDKRLYHLNAYDLKFGANSLSCRVADRLYKCTYIRRNSDIHLFTESGQLIFRCKELSLGQEQPSDDESSVFAPMTCRIANINVKLGDKVEKGATLLVLEAMKMEHVMRAPKSGQITKLPYKVGDFVPDKRLLAEVTS